MSLCLNSRVTASQRFLITRLYNRGPGGHIPFAQLPGMRAGRDLRQGEQCRVGGGHRAPVSPVTAGITLPSPALEEETKRACRGPATLQGTGLLSPVPLRAHVQEEVLSGLQSSPWEVTCRGRDGNRVSPTGIGTRSMEASLPE